MFLHASHGPSRINCSSIGSHAERHLATFATVRCGPVFASLAMLWTNVCPAHEASESLAVPLVSAFILPLLLSGISIEGAILVENSFHLWAI